MSRRDTGPFRGGGVGAGAAAAADGSESQASSPSEDYKFVNSAHSEAVSCNNISVLNKLATNVPFRKHIFNIKRRTKAIAV